ncbi:MAG TPA: SWIM zinc finger family protein, partial [Gemmataceae bacterium]
MVELARLTKPKILRQVGEASVHKAKAYLRKDVWSDLRVQGDTVKGRCRGQAPDPYRVAVTFEGDAIAGADCSCPVGAGGHCKHVAALLLYYREHPDVFVEVEELDAALERRGKGELVALIRRMIRRVPELELLLEAPLPGYTDPAAAEDPEPYRRQARAAFAHGGDEWGSAPAVAHELADIVATGDEFRAAGAHAAAVAVYRAVAEEVLRRFERFPDDDGDLLVVVGDCATGLCHCLEAAAADAPHRDALLRALVDLYVADESHGGLGVSDSVPEALLHRTTAAERRWIAARLREALPRGESWSDEYQRRAIGSFLLELEAEELDDEAYLRLCRETGRAVELVDRLLTLDRLAEAMKAIKAADDHDLL